VALSLMTPHQSCSRWHLQQYRASCWCWFHLLISMHAVRGGPHIIYPTSLGEDTTLTCKCNRLLIVWFIIIVILNGSPAFLGTSPGSFHLSCLGSTCCCIALSSFGCTFYSSRSAFGHVHLSSFSLPAPQVVCSELASTKPTCLPGSHLS